MATITSAGAVPATATQLRDAEVASATALAIRLQSPAFPGDVPSLGVFELFVKFYIFRI